MMLRESFGLLEEAEIIEGAIEKTLRSGFRTADIASAGKKEKSPLCSVTSASLLSDQWEPLSGITGHFHGNPHNDQKIVKTYAR